MKKINNILYLDLNKKNRFNICIKQLDKKSRVLKINLLDGSIPYDVTNLKVMMYFVKPDGKNVFLNANVLNASKGIVDIELSNQVLSTSGWVQCELNIVDPSEGSILTSNVFNMMVDPTIRNDQAIASCDEYAVLVDIIQKDLKRDASEKIRVSQEQQRVLDENKRATQEQQRISKESQRATQEQQRATQEQQRVSKESQRVLDENKRVSQESQRVTQESQRVSQESQRVQEFKQMKTNVDTCVSKVNDIPKQITNHNHDDRYTRKHITWVGKGDDLNNVLTQGEYAISDGVKNAPISNNTYAKLLVYVSDGTTHTNGNNWIWQVIYMTNGDVYKRQKINKENWGTWVRFITSNNIVSSNNDVFGKIPVVGNDGVMEIGSMLDFHVSNGDGDNSGRLQVKKENFNFIGGDLLSNYREVASGKKFVENGWHMVHLGGKLYNASRKLVTGSMNNAGGVICNINLPRTFKEIISINVNSGCDGDYSKKTSGYVVVDEYKNNSLRCGVYNASANKPTVLFINMIATI